MIELNDGRHRLRFRDFLEKFVSFLFVMDNILSIAKAKLANFLKNLMRRPLIELNAKAAQQKF